MLEFGMLEFVGTVCSVLLCYSVMSMVDTLLWRSSIYLRLIFSTHLNELFMLMHFLVTRTLDLKLIFLFLYYSLEKKLMLYDRGKFFLRW